MPWYKEDWLDSEVAHLKSLFTIYIPRAVLVGGNEVRQGRMAVDEVEESLKVRPCDKQAGLEICHIFHGTTALPRGQCAILTLPKREKGVIQ